MSVEKEDIVAKIDLLDTADEPTQRRVRDFLIEHAEAHVDLICANLTVVDGRTRRGLVRVLVELGDRRALLPLMRFIYDGRENHEESDARAIAMRHLLALAEPRDRGRLFDFFIDLRSDSDPYVRGYAIEGLGELDDPRAKAVVERACDDDDEFVREKASRAREQLASATEIIDDIPARDDLTREIRNASGVRLRFLLEELVQHPEGFEIARELLMDAGSSHTTAVEALRRIGDSRTRQIARSFLKNPRPDSERASTLRLLADFIDGDATAQERTIVRNALESSDIFVRLAALEAAARSGDRELVLDVIDRSVDDGLNGIETVAEGLSRARLPRDEDVASRLLELLEKVQIEMRHSRDKTWELSVAYLLRGLRRAAPSGWRGRDDVIDVAIDAMRDRPHSRPIAVTALEALLEFVPEDGLPRRRRWHADDVRLPVRACRLHGADLLARALDIIARVAPPADLELGDWLEDALNQLDSVDGHISLIHALREVHPDNAEELLLRLTDHDVAAIKKAAEAALRRIQNDRDVIEVDFQPVSAQDSSD